MRYNPAHSDGLIQQPFGRFELLEEAPGRSAPQRALQRRPARGRLLSGDFSRDAMPAGGSTSEGLPIRQMASWLVSLRSSRTQGFLVWDSLHHRLPRPSRGKKSGRGK